MSADANTEKKTRNPNAPRKQVRSTPGLIILGRSSNWYAARSRQQLLADERDHSAFAPEAVDQIIIPMLDKQGMKLAEDAPTLSFETTSVKEGVVGQGYNEQLKAKGGYPPYRFELTEDAKNRLPEGVGLRPDGTLFGVTYFKEPVSFSVDVVDSIGQVATQTFTLNTVDAPTTGTAQEGRRLWKGEGEGEISAPGTDNPPDMPSENQPATRTGGRVTVEVEEAGNTQLQQLVNNVVSQQASPASSEEGQQASSNQSNTSGAQADTGAQQNAQQQTRTTRQRNQQSQDDPLV